MIGSGGVRGGKRLYVFLCVGQSEKPFVLDYIAI